jgi:hypothetical protein
LTSQQLVQINIAAAVIDDQMQVSHGQKTR